MSKGALSGPHFEQEADVACLFTVSSLCYCSADGGNVIGNDGSGRWRTRV